MNASNLTFINRFRFFIQNNIGYNMRLPLYLLFAWQKLKYLYFFCFAPLAADVSFFLSEPVPFTRSVQFKFSRTKFAGRQS